MRARFRKLAALSDAIRNAEVMYQFRRMTNFGKGGETVLQQHNAFVREFNALKFWFMRRKAEIE